MHVCMLCNEIARDVYTSLSIYIYIYILFFFVFFFLVPRRATRITFGRVPGYPKARSEGSQARITFGGVPGYPEALPSSFLPCIPLRVAVLHHACWLRVAVLILVQILSAAGC